MMSLTMSVNSWPSGKLDLHAQGDHPVVRALFGAMNTGGFERLDGVVEDECEVFANGYRLEQGESQEGAGLLVESLRAFHDNFPDLRWQLYDEVQEKEGDKETIAIRFVFSATIDDRPHRTEVAAFLAVEDERLSAWREIVDMALANARRAAIGLDPID